MKKLISVLLIFSIFVVTSCAPVPQQSAPVTQEIEDCDFDDMIEGDADCYGVDLKKKKPVKKEVSKPQVNNVKSKKPSKVASKKRASSK